MESGQKGEEIGQREKDIPRGINSQQVRVNLFFFFFFFSRLFSFFPLLPLSSSPHFPWLSTHHSFPVSSVIIAKCVVYQQFQAYGIDFYQQHPHHHQQWTAVHDLTL